MNRYIPPSVIELANEISLGDLFRITEHERNRMGIIRMISYSKSHLMTKACKTDAEKNLLLDLIELTNEIGSDLFDEAFAASRERIAAEGVRLPLGRSELNTNRRRAQLVRNNKRAK